MSNVPPASMSHQLNSGIPMLSERLIGFDIRSPWCGQLAAETSQELIRAKLLGCFNPRSVDARFWPSQFCTGPSDAAAITQESDEREVGGPCVRPPPWIGPNAPLWS